MRVSTLCDVPYLPVASQMLITFSSDYIYVIAMLKTTPLVVTVGISLTIPLAVMRYFTRQDRYRESRDGCFAHTCRVYCSWPREFERAQWPSPRRKGRGSILTSSAGSSFRIVDPVVMIFTLFNKVTPTQNASTFFGCPR